MGCRSKSEREHTSAWWGLTAPAHRSCCERHRSRHVLYAKRLAIDESSPGLSRRIRQELFDAIRRIHSEGVPVLLVEQEVAQVFRMAARNYVLSQGRILAQGSGASLMADETLRAGYLGL